MMHEILEALRELIGLGVDGLNSIQMALRALVIYITAILLVRLGQKRFMGKNTAFDVILGIILGSVLSRAITGNAPFVPTVVSGAVLVALHWLFSVVSFYWRPFGSVVKGRERLLVKDGEIQWRNMRRSHIGKHDLEMAIRNTGRAARFEDVAEAHFERSGNISIVPREREKKLRVIDVAVREGVQNVRIELVESA